MTQDMASFTKQGKPTFFPVDPGFTIKQGLKAHKNQSHWCETKWRNYTRKLKEKDPNPWHCSGKVLHCFKWSQETKVFYNTNKSACRGVLLSCAKSSHNSWIQGWGGWQTCQLSALTRMNPPQRTQSSASHPLGIGKLKWFQVVGMRLLLACTRPAQAHAMILTISNCLTLMTKQ